MYSERFQKFIEMWQKDFAIERTIDEKVCVDRDGNPLPWYTYPAIEYLSQFDYGEKTIFEFGCGYSSLFWAERAAKVISIEDNPEWLKNNFGTTRSIIATQIKDTRDNIYYPTSGMRSSFSVEKAGFGGDFSYSKFTGNIQKYYKVGRSQVIAVRGTVGYSPDDLPENSIFEVGGQDSLRGYRDGQFIGNKMWLGTIEYRFPVVKKVQGAIFTDAGDAWSGKDWNRGDTIESSMEVHSSVGLGVQMETPIGPLRIDYAWGQDGGRAHFNIGGTF